MLEENKEKAMGIMKIPVEYHPFIQNNKEIARAVGILLMGKKEFEDRIERIKHHLKNYEPLKSKLVFGTVEDLDKFMAYINSNPNQMEIYKDIPENGEKEIIKELNKVTSVVETDMSIPSEEVNRAAD